MVNTNKQADWSRTKTRVLWHHLPLFIFSLGLILLIFSLTKSEDDIFRMSLSTAYTAMVLLAATLAISPLHKILDLSNPVSTDFRRDLGFWGAIVSLAHVFYGLQVHMRGRMWLLFLDEKMIFPFIRVDRFGFANFSGLFATIILMILFATSNDWSMQKLGIKKWKKVQRWNYVLFTVVILHGVLYQLIEKRMPPYIFIFWAVCSMVIILRIAAILFRKNKDVKEI